MLELLCLVRAVALTSGGGTGGSNPPAYRILQSRLPAPAPFSWFPPFCPFSIAKYYAMLHNSPYFSRFPPFWNSHLPPFPLPPPIPLPPPVLSPIDDGKL